MVKWRAPSRQEKHKKSPNANKYSVIVKYMEIRMAKIPDYKTDSIYTWMLPYHWPPIPQLS